MNTVFTTIAHSYRLFSTSEDYSVEQAISEFNLKLSWLKTEYINRKKELDAKIVKRISLTSAIAAAVFMVIQVLADLYLPTLTSNIIDKG